MVDQKHLFGLTLNQPRHPLPMARAEGERLENQQVERALQQGNAIVVNRLGGHSTQVSAGLGRLSTRARILVLECSFPRRFVTGA
jgi:hypothetical protein